MLGRGPRAADVTGAALPRAIETFRVEGAGRYAIVDTSTPAIPQISCVWKPDLPASFRYARKLPTQRAAPKRLVGFVIATPPVCAGKAHRARAAVSKIEVEAEHRGAGIGCMLLEAMERKLLREARRQRCTGGVRVYLYADPTDETGRGLSARALRFYAQQGYRVAGTDALGIRMERLVVKIRGETSLRRTCANVKQRYFAPANEVRRHRDEAAIRAAIAGAYRRTNYERDAALIQREFEAAESRRGRTGVGRLSPRRIESAQRETHGLPARVSDDVYEYDSDPSSPPAESA